MIPSQSMLWLLNLMAYIQRSTVALCFTSMCLVIFLQQWRQMCLYRCNEMRYVISSNFHPGTYRHVYQWVKDIEVQMMMMIWKNHDVEVLTQENQVIIARVSNLSLSTLLVIESFVDKTCWPLMYFIGFHLMPMNLCQKSWHSSSCKILLYHRVI